MKNKKNTIIITTFTVIVLATAITVYLANHPRIEPVTPASDDSSLPSTQARDYIATDYPGTLPVEAVDGTLGSLSAYVENMLNPDLTLESLLSVSYQNQILRINITEDTGEAVLVTKENANAFTAERNPLRATKQLVNYAANSGHTINNLSITDEISTVGVKDFSVYLDSSALVAEKDGIPEHYALSGQARSEIIKYCSDMLAGNRDAEIYILSDNVIAFVMCERYSEESLLGSFSFFEKTGDDVYQVRTVIDFNC